MMSQSSMVSASGSMSMREKSQLKRRINKEHNSNFRAGYVPVNEIYLHKAGIRGRKGFLLYACLIFLLVVVALNTALMAWLMWIYHITHKGMEPLEFTRSSGGYLLRFLDPAHFDSLLLNGVYLGSRHNTSLTFSGNNSKFVMSAFEARNESMVEIEKDMVRFSVDELKLMTTPGKKEFFSLNNLKIPQLKNLKNLHAQRVETAQIKDVPNYEDLNIESWDQIQISGPAGVKTMSKKETEIQGNNLHLTSKNGLVVLDGRVVIKFTNAAGIPKNVSSADSKVNAKLCVCGHSGLVFSVPLWKPGMTCGSLGKDKNPCVA
ncbi:beta-sarcoglycan-like isoform X2 [Babylonia areolata]